MSTIYREHECTTLEEVNALALTDGEENGAYVFAPTGEQSYWYAEGQSGHWSYEDGYGGDVVRFPLAGSDKVIVLVPISVEDLIRDTVAETLAEQARQEAVAAKERQEFNAEVRRRMEEKYMGDAFKRTAGFSQQEKP